MPPVARYSQAFLRPEGAAQSGMGHLYRARNLAAALRPDFEVLMLIDEAPAAFLTLLDNDAIAWRRFRLRSPGPTPITDQVMIFDSYRFDAADFASARRLGNLVVAIDDLALADFDCDLVLSPGPQNRETDYRASAGCRFLLGPEYALINPCFYAESYRFKPLVRRLFVGFGGSDPGDVTSFVVGALGQTGIEIEVLIGPEYRHFDRLQAVMGPKIRLHHGLPQAEVARLMAQCDAGVSGGGTMCLEAAAVGLPAILFPAVDNHRRPCLAMAEQGLAAYGGDIPELRSADFRRTVEGFLGDADKRQAIHRRTREIFREPGVARVATEISALAAVRRSSAPAGNTKPDVRLSPFGAAHLERTRQWIADPRIALPFLFAADVTADTHRAWFARQRADRSQCLFAIEDGEETHVGNVGFKCIDREAGSAELWSYIAPERQRRGLGSAAVTAAVAAGFDQLRLSHIYLYVSADNQLARRAYENAGFRLTERNARTIDFKGRPVALDRFECAEPGVGSRRPRIAMMQPMFLPWLGYFELMASVDIFVFLDDFQFVRQAWGHRNRLFLSPGSPGLVSIPISHPGNLKATFLEVALAPDHRWQAKLGRSLSQSYGKSPRFAPSWARIEKLIKQPAANLADYEIAIAEAIAGELGVATEFRRSSAYPTAGLGRSERLVALLDAVGAGSYYAARGSAEYLREDGVFPLKRLPVFFQDFQPVPYPQTGSPTFVPRLSALDALFNLPTKDARAAMRGTRRWLPWDEVMTIADADSSPNSSDSLQAAGDTIDV